LIVFTFFFFFFAKKKKKIEFRKLVSKKKIFFLAYMSVALKEIKSKNMVFLTKKNFSSFSQKPHFSPKTT